MRSKTELFTFEKVFVIIRMFQNWFAHLYMGRSLELEIPLIINAKPGIPGKAPKRREESDIPLDPSIIPAPEPVPQHVPQTPEPNIVPTIPVSPVRR